MDCPKGTQTIDVICSGVPSHKELHECCDVTKPFLIVVEYKSDTIVWFQVKAVKFENIAFFEAQTPFSCSMED